MGFEYDFEASDEAWAMRRVRSDELETSAEGQISGSQQCNVPESAGVRAIAKVGTHV